MPGAPRLVIQTLRDVTIVDLHEPHIRDMNQVQQIATELYDLVDNKTRRNLILDFSKVVLLSSSALGVLITLNKKTQTLGGKLVMVGLKDDIYNLFKLAKMHKLFTFCATEDEALGHFGITSAG
jgi:anti-sigma B factor antagonist